MKGWLVVFSLALFRMLQAFPFAYVANYNSASVSIIDLATHSTVGYVNTSGFTIANPLDVRHSPDGKKAYLVADISNAVFVIDTMTNAIVREVDSRAFPFNAPAFVHFSPDGTK